MPQADDLTLEKELREIIANITEIDPAGIKLESRFIEDLGMDSMMALEILAAMEKKYKIQVPEEKLGRLTNLKETINLTKEYLK
ncbi:MAG: acyl carrier protein [Candidatus Omnitrophota bacterium]|nr:acyl carrier protein [Candidatus Omnitrophota bacterium]